MAYSPAQPDGVDRIIRVSGFGVDEWHLAGARRPERVAAI